MSSELYVWNTRHLSLYLNAKTVKNYDETGKNKPRVWNFIVDNYILTFVKQIKTNYEINCIMV